MKIIINEILESEKALSKFVELSHLANEEIKEEQIKIVKALINFPSEYLKSLADKDFTSYTATIFYHKHKQQLKNINEGIFVKCLKEVIQITLSMIDSHEQFDKEAEKHLIDIINKNETVYLKVDKLENGRFSIFVKDHEFEFSPEAFHTLFSKPNTLEKIA